MRTKYTLPLFIATLLAAAGLWAGCTVGFDTADAGTFLCESSDDCISGYECQGLDAGTDTEATCQPVGSEADADPAPPCEEIDEDGDGFGTGPDRSDCAPNTAEDCDDSDPTVYPGAPELCDNKLNDCGDWSDDAETGEGQDDFSCGACNDNVPSELSGFLGRCDESSDTCYFLPPLSGSDQCKADAGASDEELWVTCDSSQTEFTWDGGRPASELPSSCR